MPPAGACLRLLLAALLLAGARCLKNVRLELTPEVVEHGHEAVLRCDYQLEDALLYSLKWYRGTHEFYRYSPSTNPSIKIFNFTWIEVDPEYSDEKQVKIRNVGFPLSGNFSCEVTTDAPTFSTKTSSKTLAVVSVPKSKPVILSERQRYEPGDTLKANCSSPSSTPPARLSFTINDEQVESSKPTAAQEMQEHNSVTGPQAGQLQFAELHLQLEPFHYRLGQLNLRCTAKIPGIYEQSSSELQLGVTRSEPNPQKVTSDADRKCHRPMELSMLGVAGLLLLLHLR